MTALACLPGRAPAQVADRVMPPIPIEPANGGSTSQPFIVWTWFMQPVTGSGQPVSCDLVVAEMLAHQSPEEALRRNPPVLVRRRLRSSAWQTNETARGLKPGTTYAWRLIARLNGEVASESEIWTFTYVAPESAGSTSTDEASTASSAPPEPRQIEVSTATRLVAESSNRRGNLSEMPRRYARLEVDPTLDLYGTELGLSLLVSTERNSRQSQLTRGTLELQSDSRGMRLGLSQRIAERMEELERRREELIADTLRRYLGDSETVSGEIVQLDALRGQDPTQTAQELERLGLLSPSEAASLRIPQFAFGNVTPDFSPFLLSGVTLGGGTVEYHPGRIYGALAVGKLERQDEGPFRLPEISLDGSPFQFFQNLYAARIGVGRRGHSQLVLSSLYARDDRPSRSVLRFADEAPPAPLEENLVIGLSGRGLALGDAVVIDGEVNGALFTDEGDTTGSARPAPPGVRSLFKGLVRSNTVADWAGALRGSARFSRVGAQVTAGVRFVGPGYTTLGVRGLRRDNLQWDVGWDQSWRQGAVTLGFRGGQDHTGVVQPDRGLARIDRASVQGAARMRHGVALEALASWDSQNERAGGAEATIRNESDRMGLRLRRSGALGPARSLTALGVDWIRGASNDVTGRHSSTSVHLSELLSLSSKMALLARVSHTATATAIDDGPDADVWAGEGSVLWDLGQRLHVTSGATASRGTNSRQMGAFVGAKVSLGEFGSIDTSWSVSDARFPSDASRDFTDKILSVRFLTPNAARGPGP